MFALNYVSADRRLGKETDGRVVATISSKINERFTINGKVGVPFGGINESAIVGDLEVQYRVNEDGTLNLRLFNRENDVNYIGRDQLKSTEYNAAYAIVEARIEKMFLFSEIQNICKLASI